MLPAFVRFDETTATPPIDRGRSRSLRRCFSLTPSLSLLDLARASAARRTHARRARARARRTHARTPRPPQVLRRIADVHGFSDFDGVRGALHGGGDDDDAQEEEEAKAEERAPLLFPGVRRA